MPLGDSGRHTSAVGVPPPGHAPSEVGQDRRGVLPRPRHAAPEGAVAGQGVALEGAQAGHHLRPEGIQVDVAGELEEILGLLHHDRCVPVLEEVDHPMVSAVEASTHGGVRSTGMLRGKGRATVRPRRWA